ncbi:MAG: DUF6064 family protein [Thermoanaerobaculia bacterium]
MSEWWTYSLSDLILFSRGAYFRLIELYNAAIWPAQIGAFALGVVILERSLRGGARAGRGRGIAALLAAAWLWVAIAFHAARYSTLNTAAPAFAWIFAIEAALLLGIGVFRGRLVFGRPATRSEWCGFVLFVFALAGLPFLALFCGRGLRAAEVFGLAPDPTAVGTLGLVLMSKSRPRWPLMIVPTIWCVATGAILSVLKTPDFWIAPLAAAFAVVAAVSSRSAARA